MDGNNTGTGGSECVPETEEFNTSVARYSGIIVKYRNLNIEIGARNDQLASKYERLTGFNQELGDDLASFDLEMSHIKEEIHRKSGRFRELRKESDRLAKLVDTYRDKLFRDRDFNDSTQKLKRLEGKRRALLRKFQELQGERIDVESHDILKARADLIEHVRCIDEENVELMSQIELLKHILDERIPIDDIREELDQKLEEKDDQLAKVNQEIASLDEKIRALEVAVERRRKEKLTPQSESSEMADDEMSALSVSTPIRSSEASESDFSEEPRQFWASETGTAKRKDGEFTQVRKKLERCESDKTHSPVANKTRGSERKRYRRLKDEYQMADDSWAATTSRPGHRYRDRKRKGYDLDEDDDIMKTPRRHERKSGSRREFDSDQTLSPRRSRKHEVLRSRQEMRDGKDKKEGDSESVFEPEVRYMSESMRLCFRNKDEKSLSPRKQRKDGITEVKHEGKEGEQKREDVSASLVEYEHRYKSEAMRHSRSKSEKRRQFDSDQTLSPRRSRKDESPKHNLKEGKEKNEDDSASLAEEEGRHKSESTRHSRHKHEEKDAKEKNEDEFASVFEQEEHHKSEAMRHSRSKSEKRRQFDSDQTLSPRRSRKDESARSKHDTKEGKEKNEDDSASLVEEEGHHKSESTRHSRHKHEEKDAKEKNEDGFASIFEQEEHHKSEAMRHFRSKSEKHRQFDSDQTLSPRRSRKDESSNSTNTEKPAHEQEHTHKTESGDVLSPKRLQSSQAIEQPEKVITENNPEESPMATATHKRSPVQLGEDDSLLRDNEIVENWKSESLKRHKAQAVSRDFDSDQTHTPRRRPTPKRRQQKSAQTPAAHHKKLELHTDHPRTPDSEHKHLNWKRAFDSDQIRSPKEKNRQNLAEAKPALPTIDLEQEQLDDKPKKDQNEEETQACEHIQSESPRRSNCERINAFRRFDSDQTNSPKQRQKRKDILKSDEPKPKHASTQREVNEKSNPLIGIANKKFPLLKTSPVKVRRNAMSEVATHDECGTQTNEAELEKDPYEMTEANAEAINALQRRITGKKDEAKALEIELGIITPEYVLSTRPLLSWERDPFSESRRKNFSTQTELMGSFIDFHMDILAEQDRDQQQSEVLKTEIAQLQAEVNEMSQTISEAKLEGERLGLQVERIAPEIESVESIMDTTEYILKSKTVAADTNADISRLKFSLITKSQRLKDISRKKKEAKALLEILEQKRLSLEREIDRLAEEDQSELKEIGSDVTAFSARKKSAKHRYQVLEADLSAKQALVDSLARSQEQNSYRDLMLKRANLQRRLTKWTTLLRDVPDSPAEIESFTREHGEIRKQLRDKVKSFTEKELDLKEELHETENYRKLLRSILREHQNHWT